MDNVEKFTTQSDIEAQASDWLARLDSDTSPSKQEMADLSEWVNRSPAHREAMRCRAEFWQQANVMAELSFPLYRKQSFLNRSFGARFYGFNWPSITAVAAIFMLSSALGLIIWLDDKGRIDSPRVVGNGIYETRVGEQNTIALVDGSVIELNTNSRVQINYDNEQRAVALVKGEAHFDVSKDPSRPFEVAAGKGVVRAVGTAFSVRYDQRVVQVIVTEGKVALAAVDATSTLPATQRPMTDLGALVAGESVEFEPLSAKPVIDDIQPLQAKELDQKMAWRNGLMLFNGESLDFVVKEMNRYASIKIEISDPLIAKINIGGQFKIGETEAMLRNLSIGFGIDVHRVNDSLIRLSKKNEK